MQGARKFFVYVSFCILLLGCSSRPDRVRPVDIDPASASSAALELYDKDADGALAGAELAAVPGIKKHVNLYDRDGDGRVTREEIAARLQSWNDNSLALHGATFAIQLDGQWLDGATVTLVPEPYLGENVKPATGVTMSNGFTDTSHADEFLPKSTNGRPMAGVFSGTYKVQITHPSRQIPARYNTATELGEEIAFDLNPTGDPIRIAITSK
jgi:hypothetical protein